MSELKSQAVTRSAFDRRSLIKGAAWSVPVIAAAVAAPAAAASPRTATVAFAAAIATTFVKKGDAPSPRSGTAAHTFTLRNTAGAITGTISGTFTIQLGTAKRNMYITTISTPAGSTGLSGSMAGSTYTGNFSYTGTIAGGADLVFTISGFMYEGDPSLGGGTYAATVGLTLPGTTTQKTSSLTWTLD